jgi:hypothetical protein
MQRKAVRRRTPSIPANRRQARVSSRRGSEEAPGEPIASSPGFESAECASSGCEVHPAVPKASCRVVTGLVDRKPLRRLRNPVARKPLAF